MGRRPWPLPPNARVGTSSQRRRLQLVDAMSDVTAVDIRGNVPTRLEKLRAGQYEAVILARAGLDRLAADVSDLTVIDLLGWDFLPAPGQGALAVQCRTNDTATAELVRSIHHEETAWCTDAERGLMRYFEGGCSLALGALAASAGTEIEMSAIWFDDGGRRHWCGVAGADAATVARRAFESLMAC